MGSSNRNSSQRLAFLDWTRGLAAVVMLQGHVFHSFTDKTLRNDGPYVLSQFIGGMTPAVFLFLTGITLAFLMDSRARQGQTPKQRMAASLNRAGFLIAMAFLFRLQLWLFAAGQSPWTDLFKVDILNAMALGVAVFTPLAVLQTAERIRWSLFAGAGIAAAAPLVSAIDWSWLNPFVRAYFVPDTNYFAFFPWASFIAFGITTGSAIRLLKDEHMDRAMQWSAVFGIGLVAAAGYFASIPYSLYAKSDFWLNSPALIFIKTGIILAILPLAFVWTRYASPVGSTSWVRLLGTNSLLVYWVHTELVYGRWFGRYKEALSVPQTITIAVLVIASMVLLAGLWRGWRGLPNVPELLRRYLGSGELAPQRAAGD